MKCLNVLLPILLLTACGKGGASNAVTGDECGLPDGQTGIKICSFVATPTLAESVSLKNYDSTPVDLSNYTLWDANALSNGTGQKSLSGTLNAGSQVTFGRLPFQINDSGETITLKNMSSVIHQRNN